MNEFATTIERWYNEHKRDLPWRETTDPYQIWISEIILQQTRVAQGYAYFLKFMERFPTVKSLAEAPEDEVMRLWQGLGYYSRARNLHEAARMIASREDGFPKTYEEVRALKGIGEYTAAAICSFAYGLPYAAVDGNVYRVLSRWLGIDTPIDTVTGKKLFSKWANQLLDTQHPGLYNQAIMDFGALQCLPQSPDCSTCPLEVSCVARKEGCVDKLPVKSHRTKVLPRYFNYIYVRAGAFTFIHKRTDDDIWKNLYELPLVESDTPWTEEELYGSDKLQAWIVPRETPTFRCLQREIKHVLSHRVIYATFYEVILPEDTHSFAGFERIKINELEEYAVPRLLHRFFEQFIFQP